MIYFLLRQSPLIQLLQLEQPNTVFHSFTGAELSPTFQVNDKTDIQLSLFSHVPTTTGVGQNNIFFYQQQTKSKSVTCDAGNLAFCHLWWTWEIRRPFINHVCHGSCSGGCFMFRFKKGGGEKGTLLAERGARCQLSVCLFHLVWQGVPAEREGIYLLSDVVYVSLYLWLCCCSCICCVTGGWHWGSRAPCWERGEGMPPTFLSSLVS